MNTTRILGLSALTLALSTPVAYAEGGAHAEKRGEHPAVIVAHKGVQPDPTSNFYLHPARLSWSLQRPASEDEPAKLFIAGGDAVSHPSTARASTN